MQAVQAPEPYVVGLIYQLARDLHRSCPSRDRDRQDVEQELHLVWSRRRSQYVPGRGALTTYAKVVLTRAAESLRRSVQAIKRGGRLDIVSLPEDVPCRDAGCREGPLDRIEVRERVRGVLRRAPHRLREVAALLRDGYSERGIARRLGCSRQEVQRLRLRLRDYCAAHRLHELLPEVSP